MVDQPEWRIPDPFLTKEDVGVYGHTLWVHMAMWCPVALAKIRNPKLAFKSLDQEVTDQIELVQLRFMTAGIERVEAGERAEEAVLAEWKIPRESKVPVWDGLTDELDPWEEYAPEVLVGWHDQEWVDSYIATLPAAAQQEFQELKAELEERVRRRLGDLPD